MNINEHASGDINTYRGSEKPPYTRLTLNAIPKVKKPFFCREPTKMDAIRTALYRTVY